MENTTHPSLNESFETLSTILNSASFEVGALIVPTASVCSDWTDLDIDADLGVL